MNKKIAAREKQKLSNMRKRDLVSVGTLLVTIVCFVIIRMCISSGVINTQIEGIINLVGINIIAAVSLNMVAGMLGQLALGHASFMLVGAYTGSIFVNAASKAHEMSLYVSMPIALLLAGIMAAIFGIAIGIPALRLRGDYLAIITLGFGEIVRVISNALSFTGGAQGYRGYPTFSTRSAPGILFTFIFWIAIFTIFFAYTFATSRHGRCVITIREDEIASENSGINIVYYKLLTFALSAFFGGIAGALLAFHIRIIDPGAYGFNRSIEILMMVVLGGMGSITGSVIAGGVLTVLPELLRGFDQWRMLIYSIVLICVMLFRPKGLLGRAEIQVIKPFEVLRERLARRRKGGV